MSKLPFFLLVLFATLAYSIGYSQEKLPEFGKVDIADLQMQECPLDRNANAMNLIKIETIGFSVDGFTRIPKTEAQYWVRTKIFNERGFKHANIVIPYNVNSHTVKITDIDAYIYTLGADGKVVRQKVDGDDIFKEKSNSAKSNNSVRFTFAGLKKGDIIEYRYTRIDRNVIYLPTWLMQGEIPCRFTQCIVSMPDVFHMQYHTFGSLPVGQDSTSTTYYKAVYNDTKRTFTLRDVPAFKPEPYMSSLKDNVQRIEFGISVGTPTTHLVVDAASKWAGYSAVLQHSSTFGGQYVVQLDNTASFIDSLKTCKHQSDIINAAYCFVKRNVTWNGEHKFSPVNLTDCWKDKTGSSGDMNILLLNLLHAAGITCDPVLVSTRENGIIDQSFYSTSQFNSVDVLAIDSNRSYILDCTQKNLSYKTTPFDVFNRNGLLIDELNTNWMTITDSKPLMQTTLNMAAVMDSTGVLKGKGRMVYTGMAKAEAIKDAVKEEKSNDNSSNLAGNDGGELKIDSSLVLHSDDDNDSLINLIAFHYDLSNTGNIYFLNPYMFSMFKKNPFQDSVRITDIDFGGSQEYSTSITIYIPPIFSIEDIPKSIFIHMEDSAVMFKREIVSGNNQLLIRNSFTINRPDFDKEEYSGLKTFFDKIYGLINEQIILKKKE